MNLLDFYRQYPDESSCQEALRRFRERHGLFCMEKPRDFDPFGQTGFAHLWLQYD